MAWTALIGTVVQAGVDAVTGGDGGSSGPCPGQPSWETHLRAVRNAPYAAKAQLVEMIRMANTWWNGSVAELETNRDIPKWIMGGDDCEISFETGRALNAAYLRFLADYGAPLSAPADPDFSDLPDYSNPLPWPDSTSGGGDSTGASTPWDQPQPTTSGGGGGGSTTDQILALLPFLRQPTTTTDSGRAAGMDPTMLAWIGGAVLVVLLLVVMMRK